VRRGYYWLIGFAGVVLLAVLAIWQVPQWLDWTRYRDTIEVLATTMLGRPVAIQGPIALTVLPEPLLTATQVDIGTGRTADVSVHVKALRLRVALWPMCAFPGRPRRACCARIRQPGLALFQRASRKAVSASAALASAASMQR
jgi:hypothetical protein